MEFTLYNVILYPTINSAVICGNLIVTEKIHGSNIGIGFVNGYLRIQSRHKIIDKNYQNFGFQEIINPLIALVEKMKPIMNHDNFLVYGEIFGNQNIKIMKYNDSEASKKAFNSETVFFRAFDILDIGKRVFLKYSDAIKIFEQVGLPYVPILKDIQYTDAKDLYTLVETCKSAYSEFPVEGFVVKKDEIENYNGRTIFKVRRRQFDTTSKKIISNKYKVKNYVDKNRFLSAYSKIGNDLEAIKNEMIEDSLEDIISVFRIEVTDEVETYLKKNYNKILKNVIDL